MKIKSVVTAATLTLAAIGVSSQTTSKTAKAADTHSSKMTIKVKPGATVHTYMDSDQGRTVMDHVLQSNSKWRVRDVTYFNGGVNNWHHEMMYKISPHHYVKASDVTANFTPKTEQNVQFVGPEQHSQDAQKPIQVKDATPKPVQAKPQPQVQPAQPQQQPHPQNLSNSNQNQQQQPQNNNQNQQPQNQNDFQTNKDDNKKILDTAKSMKGWFTYGGHSISDIGSVANPNKNGTTDCSGFVWLVLNKAGFKTPFNMGWTTSTMENDAKKDHKWLQEIPANQAKAGDIVIVNKDGGLGSNGHTAILNEDWKQGNPNGNMTSVIEMGGLSMGGINDAPFTSAFLSLLQGNRTVTFVRPVESDGADSPAKAYIAQHESGGSYTARNGRYYGKYQLDLAYLHGDLSPQNQEKVANQYAMSRYGSWENAQKHWVQYSWW